MATPETMWLTLKVTVAMAWIRPPSIPPAMAISRPTQGPNFQAPTAPNQVPKIIMPSMPMLTTPTRSAYRPARPASRIGIVNSSVVYTVNDADSFSAPSALARMNDIVTNIDAMITRVRRPIRARHQEGAWSLGAASRVIVAFMPPPLQGRVGRQFSRRCDGQGARTPPH